MVYNYIEVCSNTICSSTFNGIRVIKTGTLNNYYSMKSLNEADTGVYFRFKFCLGIYRKSLIACVLKKLKYRFKV